MTPFRYCEYPPPRDCADHVLAFWSFEVLSADGPPSHHAPPDGCVSLVVRLAGRDTSAVLLGPTLVGPRVMVGAGARYCGARLWPDAGPVVLGIAPAKCRDRVVPLAQIMGDAGGRLGAALAACRTISQARASLERALRARVRTAAALDGAVRAAVRSIVTAHGRAPIGAVAAAVGLSERQLQRRFGAAVGLSPKQFARLRRFRSALAAAVAEQGLGWAALAARFGYADQAHLTHELGRLTGLTPTSFGAHLGRIEHVDIHR